MCKWVKSGANRIDPCMREEIRLLNRYLGYTGGKTLSCCCGHGKYPKTIVLTSQGKVFAITEKCKIELKRKKRFYRRDSEDVYFIPEIQTVLTQPIGDDKKRG